MNTSPPQIRRAPRAFVLAAAMAALALPGARAQSAADFAALKAMVDQMKQTINTQNARLAELEKKPGAPASTTPSAATVANSPSLLTMDKVAGGGTVGQQSPVTNRHALNDQQEAASRPKDYTLDPQYRGFIPIPNTPVLIKLNAKPHVDMVVDNRNPGNQNRFVPANFPLEGSPEYGGGSQFHMNANATQIRVDVRAPEMDGNFRFYYQNDFFGSGSDVGDMKYRIQHVYGQFHGFKAGFTYGIFEDPDSWPDTVDYEGPNAVLFSRRPVAQYTYSLDDHWSTTLGVEEPDTYIDLNSGPNAGGNSLHKMPDLGFNTRFESKGFGHMQISALFRNLGAKDATGKDHSVVGWGLNLSLGLDVGEKDTLQFLGVYGEGVGGQGNDAGFTNSDAAFDAIGDLEPLPYGSVMLGYTHHWNDEFRSTVTYGYVKLDNSTGQAGTFYHITEYASANLVWQMRKHLSVGFETLYGTKETKNGMKSGEHWRAQVGMVYSIFD